MSLLVPLGLLDIFQVRENDFLKSHMEIANFFFSQYLNQESSALISLKEKPGMQRFESINSFRRCNTVNIELAHLTGVVFFCILLTLHLFGMLTPETTENTVVARSLIILMFGGIG